MIRSASRSAPVHVPTAVLLGSFALDAHDRLHDLIRTARSGDPGAIAEVLRGVRRAITGVWPEITDAVVAPVPRHVPGPANGLVMATCEAIAEARGWRLVGNALQRTSPAPEGKAGGRRDLEREAGTLTWDGSTAGPVIVLVDDVVRTGTTLNACVKAMRDTGDERALLAIALARPILTAGQVDRGSQTGTVAPLNQVGVRPPGSMTLGRRATARKRAERSSNANGFTR